MSQKLSIIRCLLRAVLDFVVFGNLYIGVCALVMCRYTQLFFLLPSKDFFLPFVFFSTLCSYSFHWFLTPVPSVEIIVGSFSVSEMRGDRVNWTLRYKKVLGLLFVIGSLGAIYCFVPLIAYIIWLAPVAFLTGLYSAPKIPFAPFIYLRGYVVGKTLYLTVVWTYVTAVLPLLLLGKEWSLVYSAFVMNRFFLILPICMLFDYRDLQEDKASGIRNLMGFMTEWQMTVAYRVCLFLGFAMCAWLSLYSISGLRILTLGLAGFVLAVSIPRMKRYESDYWYYVYLDSLMAGSGFAWLVFGYW